MQNKTNQLTKERKTGAKTALAKVAVQYSAVRQLAEINQTLLLRINICYENRHLRQARKRYRQRRKTYSITN